MRTAAVMSPPRKRLGMRACGAKRSSTAGPRFVEKSDTCSNIRYAHMSTLANTVWFPMAEVRQAVINTIQADTTMPTGMLAARTSGRESRKDLFGGLRRASSTIKADATLYASHKKPAAGEMEGGRG